MAVEGHHRGAAGLKIPGAIGARSHAAGCQRCKSTVAPEPAADEARLLGRILPEEIRLHADLVKAARLVPQ